MNQTNTKDLVRNSSASMENKTSRQYITSEHKHHLNYKQRLPYILSSINSKLDEKYCICSRQVSVYVNFFHHSKELIVKRSSPAPPQSLSYYLLLATSLTSNTTLLLILIATIVRSTYGASSTIGPDNQRNTHMRYALSNHRATIVSNKYLQQIPKILKNHNHNSNSNKYIVENGGNSFVALEGNKHNESNNSRNDYNRIDRNEATVLNSKKQQQQRQNQLEQLVIYSTKLINLPQILSQKLAKLWLDRVGKLLGRNATPKNTWSLMNQLNSSLMMLSQHHLHRSNHQTFYPEDIKSSNDLEILYDIASIPTKVNKTNNPVIEERKQKSATLPQTKINHGPNGEKDLETTTCDYNDRNNRAMVNMNQLHDNTIINEKQENNNDNHQQQDQPQQQQQSQQNFQPEVGEARQKRRLLKRIMKKADWNALLIEVSKVFLRYFLDLILNDMLGKSGTYRKHLDPQSNVTDMLRDFIRAASGL